MPVKQNHFPGEYVGNMLHFGGLSLVLVPAAAGVPFGVRWLQIVINHQMPCLCASVSRYACINQEISLKSADFNILALPSVIHACYLSCFSFILPCSEGCSHLQLCTNTSSFIKLPCLAIYGAPYSRLISLKIAPTIINCHAQRNMLGYFLSISASCGGVTLRGYCPAGLLPCGRLFLFIFHCGVRCPCGAITLRGFVLRSCALRGFWLRLRKMLS